MRGKKGFIFSFIEQRFHVFLINEMKTINQNLLRFPPLTITTSSPPDRYKGGRYVGEGAGDRTNILIFSQI